MPRREPRPGRNAPERRAPDSIRATALELLCAVDHYEDKGLPPGPDNRLTDRQAAATDGSTIRSVGLRYADILGVVREKFPGCGTSVECLRWYASQIRDGMPGYEDRALPQRRPRSGSGRAETDAEANARTRTKAEAT